MRKDVKVKQKTLWIMFVILISACGTLREQLPATESPAPSEESVGKTETNAPIFTEMTPSVVATTQNVLSTSDACKNDYFPVVKGARWVYKITIGSSSDAPPLYELLEIINVVPDGFQSVTLLSQTDDFESIENLPESNIKNGTCSSGGVISIHSESVRDFGSGYFPVIREMPVGSTWEVQLGNETPVSFTSHGIETVTVPFGTYDAVKIEGNLGHVGGPSDSIEWYAMGIGRVKAYVEIGKITKTTELVSFSIEK